MTTRSRWDETRALIEAGWHSGWGKERCGQCGGTGKVLVCPMSFDGDSDRLIPDLGCDEWEPCDECGGTGLWDADDPGSASSAEPSLIDWDDTKQAQHDGSRQIYGDAGKFMRGGEPGC